MFFVKFRHLSATTYFNSFIPLSRGITRALTGGVVEANALLMGVSPPQLSLMGLAVVQPCSPATRAMRAATGSVWLPSHLRGGEEMLCLTKSYSLQYFQPCRNVLLYSLGWQSWGHWAITASEVAIFQWMNSKSFLSSFVLSCFAKNFIPWNIPHTIARFIYSVCDVKDFTLGIIWCVLQKLIP